LTAKALRDVQIKQKQRLRAEEGEKEQPEESPTTTCASITTNVEMVEAPSISGKSKTDGEVTKVFLMGEKGQKPVLVSIPSQPVEDSPAPHGKTEFFPPASGPNHSYVR